MDEFMDLPLSRALKTREAHEPTLLASTIA
jgi:hypothetical protein